MYKKIDKERNLYLKVNYKLKRKKNKKTYNPALIFMILLFLLNCKIVYGEKTTINENLLLNKQEIDKISLVNDTSIQQPIIEEIVAKETIVENSYDIIINQTYFNHENLLELSNY